MAVDTPAKIAILGAGPIGLEAALYARFLGYEVALYERGDSVASAVKAWGHVRMFTPFSMNCSPLGLAALKAQRDEYAPPNGDALLTGAEWRERYLEPLAATDLLVDQVKLSTTVVRVGKAEVHKGDLPGHEDRGDWPFRILMLRADAAERIDEADAVIDTTGIFLGRPRWLGYGGMPAVGEIMARKLGQIEHFLPDLSGEMKNEYEGRHTLLIGGGYSAATTAVTLAALAARSPGTRLTWITRHEPTEAAGPMPLIPSDRLPERARLGMTANAVVNNPSSGVCWWPGDVVEAIVATDADQFQIQLAGPHEGLHVFDRIIANVGYTPDRTLYEELQVHECYATQGPMKLAAALSGSNSSDCLDQRSCGPLALVNPEPNFYILGAKSYGRKSNFLFSAGLQQIRDVFKIIGDRETLDLYANPPG